MAEAEPKQSVIVPGDTNDYMNDNDAPFVKKAYPKRVINKKHEQLDSKVRLLYKKYKLKDLRVKLVDCMKWKDNPSHLNSIRQEKSNPCNNKIPHDRSEEVSVVLVKEVDNMSAGVSSGMKGKALKTTKNFAENQSCAYLLGTEALLSANASVDSVRRYNLYESIKRLRFDMPDGWNDEDFALFVTCCLEKKDRFLKSEGDQTHIWADIARSGAKRSKNPLLFTINSCLTLAERIRLYVNQNSSILLDNEAFKKFHSDVKDLLPYFSESFDSKKVIKTRSVRRMSKSKPVAEYTSELLNYKLSVDKQNDMEIAKNSPKFRDIDSEESVIDFSDTLKETSVATSTVNNSDITTKYPDNKMDEDVLDGEYNPSSDSVKLVSDEYLNSCMLTDQIPPLCNSLGHLNDDVRVSADTSEKNNIHSTYSDGAGSSGFSGNQIPPSSSGYAKSTDTENITISSVLETLKKYRQELLSSQGSDSSVPTVQYNNLPSGIKDAPVPEWFAQYFVDFQKRETWKIQQVLKLQQDLTEVEHKKINLLRKILESLGKEQ